MPRQPIDDFSCRHCNLSLKKLQEMAEVGGSGEIFRTLARGSQMNIYDITEDGFMRMRRSTGRITWPLDINTLHQVHDMVHAGVIDLDPQAIAAAKINGVQAAALWGTYIAALLGHLQCKTLK